MSLDSGNNLINFNCKDDDFSMDDHSGNITPTSLFNPKFTHNFVKRIQGKDENAIRQEINRIKELAAKDGLPFVLCDLEKDICKTTAFPLMIAEYIIKGVDIDSINEAIGIIEPLRAASVHLNTNFIILKSTNSLIKSETGIFASMNAKSTIIVEHNDDQLDIVAFSPNCEDFTMFEKKGIRQTTNSKKSTFNINIIASTEQALQVGTPESNLIESALKGGELMNCCFDLDGKKTSWVLTAVCDLINGVPGNEVCEQVARLETLRATATILGFNAKIFDQNYIFCDNASHKFELETNEHGCYSISNITTM